MGVKIAQHWFENQRVGDDITHIWESYVDRFIRCNIWHVRGRDRDLLIDTGLGISSLREAVRDLLEKPVIAVATHFHFDHVGGMHEFETRVIHRLEGDMLERPPGWGALRAADFPEPLLRHFEEAGYEVPEELLAAYPRAGFDPAKYTVPPALPTWLVDAGDIIDLGDRAFEVLHLPGHSPGSIGLWEAKTGTLFSGDTVYDGPLLDELPGSNIDDFIDTMGRLRELPVTVVHGGHEPSFGRERFIELIDGYLKRRADL